MNHYDKENLPPDSSYSPYEYSTDIADGFSSKKKMQIKNAVLNIVLSFTVFGALGLLLSKIIITVLEKQMPFDVNFVQLNPFEIFNSSFKIAFLFGLYFVAPVVAFNLRRIFIDKFDELKIDGKFFFKMVFMAFILFAIGAIAAFYILIPAILYIMMGFNSALATTAVSISGYTSFCMQLIIISGLFFEIPVFYMFINKTRLLNASILLSKWKPILITIIILSILVSLQDLFTQIISVAAIAVLYLLSVLVVKFIEHN